MRTVLACVLASAWALGCAEGPAGPAAEPREGFRGPFTLLSHADPAREILAFERKASRPFVRALARAVEVANAASPDAPVALTLLRWRRDASEPTTLDLTHTPVARIEVDVRFDDWLQDTAEIAAREGRPLLLGPRRRPPGLGRVLPLLAARWDAAWVELPRGSGGAGNLEALPDGTVLLGTTAGDGMVAFVARHAAAPRIVRVETGFLAVGHVDELVSHVVFGPGRCDFALLRASPAAGLALFADHPDPPRAPRFRPSGDRFAAIQAALEARIAAAVGEIAAASPCAPPVHALPVLLDCRGGPEAPHGCRTRLPNPVNLAVLGRHVLLADPGDARFRRATAAALRALDQTPHFLPAEFQHARGGGVHCATNVRRAASPAVASPATLSP